MNLTPGIPRTDQIHAAWSHCPWGMALIGNTGTVEAANPAFVSSAGLGIEQLLGMEEADLDAHLGTLDLPRRRVEVSVEALRAVHYLCDFAVPKQDMRYLARVAEALREPLASIYGFTELLLTQNYDEPTRRDLTAMVLEQVEELGNLINERLDLTRQTDPTGSSA